jgi:hypothetical protein
MLNLERHEIIEKLLKQYEDVLTYLKTHGALLNTVRPEYLLNMQDYIRYLQMRPNNYTATLRQKQIELRWQYLSADSWITIINQIIKIFIVNRITPKSLKGIAGVEAERCNVDPSMYRSNIYTVSETILLKWVTYHFIKLNPMNVKTKKFYNFDTDFIDGNAFAFLIQSHCKHGIKTLNNMRTNCSNVEHRI